MTLDEMYEALKRLSNADVGPLIAAEAAPLILKSLQESASNQIDPGGNAWAPSKSGEAIYVGAAAKLKSLVSGNLIGMSISGGEAFANRGTKQLPKRRMLPDTGASTTEIDADLEKAANTVLTRLTG